MAVTYRHIRVTRQPVLWIAAAACMSLLAAAAIHGAPMPFWVVCAGSALLILWRLWTTPTFGLELDTNGLRAFAGQKSWRFNIDEIHHVELRRDSRGPDDIILQLMDGRRTRLPILSSPEPNRLACALARYGVRLYRL